MRVEGVKDAAQLVGAGDGAAGTAVVLNPGRQEATTRPIGPATLIS